MNPRRLTTGRLVLVTATSQHVLVERQDVDKLGRLVAASVGEGWPPSVGSDDDLGRLLSALSGKPNDAVWRRRYIILKKGDDNRPVLVGHVVLDGPPKFGTVHVSQLSVVDARRGQGIEREALGVVIDWAMGEDGVDRITADQPEDGAGQLGIWDDLGFAADDETGRLVKTKAAWTEDGPCTPRKLVPRPASEPVAGIPTLAREVFDRLMTEPLRDPEDMRRECALYMQVIENAAAQNPYVDDDVGREIARICDALLAAVDDDTPDHTRRQIQAAARYFVTEEDGDSDLAIGGLDEDAAVANAVAEHLGRDDLMSDLV